jgi:hypothetical protein
MILRILEKDSLILLHFMLVNERQCEWHPGETLRGMSTQPVSLEPETTESITKKGESEIDGIVHSLDEILRGLQTETEGIPADFDYSFALQEAKGEQQRLKKLGSSVLSTARTAPDHDLSALKKAMEDLSHSVIPSRRLLSVDDDKTSIQELAIQVTQLMQKYQCIQELHAKQINGDLDKSQYEILRKELDMVSRIEPQELRDKTQFDFL